ncbi:MAG: DnaA ATPase domain-containing protein [Leptonema sp. (in: bacteria)]
MSGTSMWEEKLQNTNQNHINKEYHLTPLSDWQECQKEIKKYIPEPFYSHFIEPLMGSYDKEGIIAIYTYNEKLQSHIEIRYQSLLKDIIFNFYKNKLNINSIKFIDINKAKSQEFKFPVHLKHESSLYFNKEDSSIEHNFWNYGLFYPSKKNYQELTNLICLEKYFRPIYIYGPSGCGKTSLAKIWRELHKEKAYYISIPEFINSFVNSLKKKQMNQWVEHIKSYSIFLLDDFQLLKPTAKKTQEEIRNLIDYFYEKNKIFVLFSDRDFFYMNLRDDLKSRLMSFYKIHLSLPDLETKKEILKYYLNHYKIALENKVIENIALKLNGDVRYIKSSIEKLSLYSINPANLRLNEIDYILEPYYDKSNLLTIDQIIEVVCEHYKVSKEELFSNTKEKRIAFPRHMVAYFSVKFANYTLTFVAKYLHKKDHTSILYAIKKIEDLLTKDLFLQNEIEKLKEKLYLKATT